MTWLLSFLPNWGLFSPFWGYGLLIVGGLSLVAIYAPFHKIRTIAAALAIAVLASLVSYSMGYNDASKFVYGQWAAAEKAALDLAAKARTDGERDALDDSVRDPNDCHYQKDPC